MYKQVALKL